LQNAMVPRMADIIDFPKKYDPVEDLAESIGELCDGLEAHVALSALATVAIYIVAACVKPDGRAEVVDGVTQLIREGVGVPVKEVRQ
jgi:hypothetical protein